MGIEPTLSAWKAEVLPLNYTRPSSFVYRQPPVQPKVPNPPYSRTVPASHVVEGGGFEPPKAEPTDLQSAPFDRSGTPPRSSNSQFSLFRPRSSRFFGQISQLVADVPSAWSPQRDSNPRPADSYPLLLSQPPRIGVWGLDFLFTVPRPLSLGVRWVV